jgi:hypothetical protein
LAEERAGIARCQRTIEPPFDAKALQFESCFESHPKRVFAGTVRRELIWAAEAAERLDGKGSAWDGVRGGDVVKSSWGRERGWRCGEE